jgi:hypothetical protein
MQPFLRLAVISVFALVASSALAGCSSDAAPAEEAPVVLEPIGDTDIQRLTLTESAAERLNIQTATVEVAGESRVVPSAAVIIDTTGTYWVYTNPEPLVFVRTEIRPVHEEGLQAFFENGPESGTPVVTIGVPELYGAEFGIGK